MESLMIFVLGALSALGIFCLGFSFVSVLKMKKTIKNHETEISNIYASLKTNIKDVHKLTDNLERELTNSIHEVYKYTDSRLDKSSTKVGDVISSTTEILSTELQKIKDVYQTFTKQMDEFADVTLEHSTRISELETFKKIEEDKLDQLNP
jgi:methyl-accepting chemotaxis protein